jgi:prepilin peptidase CpaA
MIWLILAFVGFAAFTDLRRRQIPNWVSAAICVCGVAATAFGLTAITWGSLASGMALGFVLIGPLYAVGGFGGGDLKLIIALGAVLGPWALLSVLAGMAISGGVLAAVAIARGQRQFAYVPAIALGLLVHVVRTEAFSHGSVF